MTRIAFVATFIVALSGCAARSHRAQAQTAPDRSTIAVYAFTAPPETRVPTIDEQARAKAVAELTRRLRANKRVAVVDSPRQADATLQLFSAVQLFNPHGDASFDDRELVADVTAAGKTTRVTEARTDMGRTIYSLAKKVDKWLEANRAEIVAARRK